jgi:hypothetical protein
VVPTAIGCPVAAGLLSAADVAGSGTSYQIAFAPTVSIDIGRGAPVRIVRHVRYSVYRAGDDEWYLGYHLCDAACLGVQPVSGPYNGDDGPPITFHYFKHDGSPLISSSPTTDVGRVEIMLRASYRQPFRLPGTATAISADSMITSVTLRN